MKPIELTWGEYIERGARLRLTALGERWNSPWLIYNPFQFSYFHRLARENAPGVICTLRNVFPQACRWADVGAGSGAYAAEARRQHIQVNACEYSAVGRWMARLQGVRCSSFDLRRPVPARLRGPLDLAYCLEVAEHLPEALGERLVEYLSRLSPVVVFSAAHPGQGGTGHINEQPREYWIAKFGSAGMAHDPELSRQVASGFECELLTAWWLRRNVLVFTRKEK